MTGRERAVPPGEGDSATNLFGDLSVPSFGGEQEQEQPVAQVSDELKVEPISTDELLAQYRASNNLPTPEPTTVRPEPLVEPRPFTSQVPLAPAPEIHAYPPHTLATQRPEVVVLAPPVERNNAPWIAVLALVAGATGVLGYQAINKEAQPSSTAQLANQPQASPTPEATRSPKPKPKPTKSAKPKPTAPPVTASSSATPSVEATKITPKPKSSQPAGRLVLTAAQQEQLRLYVPDAIPCSEDPVMALKVDARSDVNLVYRGARSRTTTVLKYKLNGKTAKPQVVLHDAVDVRVCGDKNLMQSAISVDAKNGVINVDTQKMLRPSYRRIEAGVKEAQTLAPHHTWWANMYRDPRSLPQFSASSVNTINSTVNSFSSEASTLREWAYFALQVNALRQVNGMECADTARTAIAKRIKERIADQAKAQQVEKFVVKVNDEFSFSGAYYDRRNFKPWHTEPRKGAGYSFVSPQVSCSVLGGR